MQKVIPSPYAFVSWLFARLLSYCGMARTVPPLTNVLYVLFVPHQQWHNCIRDVSSPAHHYLQVVCKK